MALAAIVPTGKLTIIQEALDYFLSTISMTGINGIAVKGATFQPVVDTIFLRSSFLPNRTQLGELGTGAARRHVGLFQVDVRAFEIANPLAQTQIVDRVIDHFWRQTISRNGLIVRIGSFDGAHSVPFPSPEYEDAPWTVIPVTVPWWADAT